jgi:hypothetical protein
MLTLKDILASGNVGASALMHAAGTTAQGNTLGGETTDSYGGTSANPAASNGGVLAPDEAGPSQAGVASISSPAANLIQAYQAYSKRSGRQQDPLAARGAKVIQNQTTAPDDPLGALAKIAFVNHSGGDRNGLVGQALELNGNRYHVYIDRNGRRQVFRLPGGSVEQAAPSISAGGSRAQ